MPGLLSQAVDCSAAVPWHTQAANYKSRSIKVVGDERLPSVTYPLQSVPMLTTFSQQRSAAL